MKQLTQLIVLFFFSAITTLQAQSSYYETVINSSLLAHISANHVTREASLANFNSIFKKQKEFYEESNKKIVQVLAIHEKIYQNLYNINSLFKQSKQLKYIGIYLGNVFENVQKMNRIAMENPQYAFWVKKQTDEVINKATSLSNDLYTLTKKENRKLLMDSADRDALIDRIYMKVRLLNVSILNVINIIEFNKSRAYIYSIPVFNNFVEHDKQLAEEIMQKYRRYKHF
ncbi:hypothetical protein [Capnocytophaga sp. oral taxon 324]|jgi:hypothetical protein|uniref:hypothetical protein n=1 Tax=Capnocytophaga sp. oral taxon 324 TaxID=712211 RepID=UPI0002A2491D|nr:hypothetical protein [Capnocytophaga sp. oral taxon 324]EKY12946.1 hypothetical protein HMPREF9072_01748 [Capnocytophaga sp. oral taxon 324 str. F0483]